MRQPALSTESAAAVLVYFCRKCKRPIDQPFRAGHLALMLAKDSPGSRFAYWCEHVKEREWRRFHRLAFERYHQPDLFDTEHHTVTRSG